MDHPPWVDPGYPPWVDPGWLSTLGGGWVTIKTGKSARGNRFTKTQKPTTQGPARVGRLPRVEPGWVLCAFRVGEGWVVCAFRVGEGWVTQGTPRVVAMVCRL